MKRRHAFALEDFEASSVILFAALVAANPAGVGGAGAATAGRAAAHPTLVSNAATAARGTTKTTDRVSAGTLRRPAPAGRPRMGDAVTIAIDQLGSGRIRGFVPFGQSQ